MHIINKDKTINGKNKAMFLNNTLDFIGQEIHRINISALLAMEGL